jgi:putative ABC transport system ATP-binding protein
VIFRDLTQAFPAAVFTAIVGRSGSGKTTLLHLLAGLERPSSGHVLVAGNQLDGKTRSQLADIRRHHVALVTQDPGLVPYLTALENVELAARLRGSTQHGARDALVAVGLEDRSDQRVSHLSAGERERVAIARALFSEARLLLVDEPTAHLDEDNGRLVGELLTGMAHERNLAVVCATHDAILIKLADTTVQLDNIEGTGEDVAERSA